MLTSTPISSASSRFTRSTNPIVDSPFFTPSNFLALARIESSIATVSLHFALSFSFAKARAVERYADREFLRNRWVSFTLKWCGTVEKFKQRRRVESENVNGFLTVLGGHRYDDQINARNGFPLPIIAAQKSDITFA